jgi:hypothetical protein
MYWKQGSKIIASASLPFYVITENFDQTFTLVTEEDEALDFVHLSVANSSEVGLISAKRASEGTYLEIKGLSDPTCYLGYFAADSETDIDFRVSMPSGSAQGKHVIPILVIHDDGVTPPLSVLLDYGPGFVKDTLTPPIFWIDSI